VRETYDQDTGEEPNGEPNTEPGDIILAQISVVLVPVGPGGQEGPVACVESVFDTGYDARKVVTCTFNGVPVNTYTVEVTVNGGYYAGSGEDVLVVYDPSLGYATGGGEFYWPGTESTDNGYAGDLTNFAFTMEYNKKGTNVKGSLLLIRHTDDGPIYRVKSNALYGLALGLVDDGDTYRWASFSGKCTYLEAGWTEALGNHEFTVYVEDHNDLTELDELGDGIDRFWIEVRDRQNNVIIVISMDPEAPDNAVTIVEGSIFVPH
jgi:hypothetical protein